MSQPGSSDQAEGLADKATPGERLRKAREKLGLNREEIATQLKLDVAKIEELESGDISSIAAPVFLSGYLRAYARVVNLSDDELSADFDALVKTESSSFNPAADVATNNFGTVPDELPAHMSLAKRSWKGLAIGVVVVGAAAITGGLWLSDQNNEVELVDIREQNDTPVSEPQFEKKNDTASGGDLNLPVTPVIEEKESIFVAPSNDENVVEQAVETGDVETISDSHPVLTGQQKTQMVENSAQEIQPSDSMEISAESGSEENAAMGEVITNQLQAHQDELRFIFSQDSWVEVNDAMDQRLMYRLGKAGEVDSVSGVAPFQIYLGFVQGVDVSINGEPYDLSRFGNRRTARFQLGKSNMKQKNTDLDNG